MINVVTLGNGVKVVLENIPFVRSISFGIWVKNGSRNEDIQTNGISHFIEHMLFKGTEDRSAKDIADEIDAIGGQINAFTSKENTCYYTKTLDTHFDIALDVLSDMFFNSKFDSTEVEKELKVIIEEINMYEDTPEDLVHEILHRGIWENNSLGYPILGTEETISKFDSKTFKDYFKNNYRPDNTVISVAGNFDEKEIIKKIESNFGKFGCQGYEAKSNFEKSYKPCIITKDKNIEQVHITICFPSIPMGTNESYVLAIINTIFGGGMSSRLFQKIREEHGLSYSLYSYNSSYTDSGLFTIYAGLNPSQTDQVIKLILQEIRALSKNKISDDLLWKTKEQLKSNYLLSLENSSSRMSSNGKSLLMLDQTLSEEQIIEKIDSVTLEKIDMLIEDVFKFENMGISAVGNVKGLNFEVMLDNAKSI